MNYVAYYRVSTKRQTLGIDAQRECVSKWIVSNGGEVVAEYAEKESGKNDNRPQLEAAMKACRATGATLLIAKLDRLSRRVSFIFALQESGVKFIATDLPEFNTMTLAIFAGLAQQERELISSRTKAALKALKEKGVKLGGSYQFDDACRAKALQTRRAEARESKANIQAWLVVKNMIANGASFTSCANVLNEGGFTTAKGGKWFGTSVQRLAKIMKA